MRNGPFHTPLHLTSSPRLSDSARSHVRGHLRLYHAYVADPSGLPDDDDSLQETPDHDPDWEVVEDGEAEAGDGAAAQVPGGGGQLGCTRTGREKMGWTVRGQWDTKNGKGQIEMS